ncbi:hypothetical protein DPMN_048361 [Dreissena polymorpha]|uniref:Uncharacterized protein n=1 Tax=Dreissena polymorpha TaxID=45954 RepID=A0A9D4DC89_DREPO|nr:hypothetical protein DPMN_048361 [Dreissena polymorpha]
MAVRGSRERLGAGSKWGGSDPSVWDVSARVECFVWEGQGGGERGGGSPRVWEGPVGGERGGRSPRIWEGPVGGERSGRCPRVWEGPVGV